MTEENTPDAVVPELLGVEKALLDAVQSWATEHNGLHEGDVIPVPGHPEVTVTVVPAESDSGNGTFGLDVKGVVLSDPRNR